MASKLKKSKKSEPETVLVREYVVESAGAQRMKRNSILKADFMAIRGGFRERESRKEA
jgi:hypothetical protein